MAAFETVEEPESLLAKGERGLRTFRERRRFDRLKALSLSKGWRRSRQGASFGVGSRGWRHGG